MVFALLGLGSVGAAVQHRGGSHNQAIVQDRGSNSCCIRALLLSEDKHGEEMSLVQLYEDVHMRKDGSFIEGTQTQDFLLIDGNNVDVEDLQFRLLEKDTTIAELEMIQKFRDDKINKLQLKKKKLEEELKELHNENCKLRMDLMKSTTNEKNMFLGLIVFLIFVIVVYILK